MCQACVVPHEFKDCNVYRTWLLYICDVNLPVGLLMPMHPFVHTLPRDPFQCFMTTLGIESCHEAEQLLIDPCGRESPRCMVSS